MSKLLVEVSRVNKIEKHPNADRLRIATIKGWNCIIGLTDFQEGDLVVFIPPDSVIPEELAEKYNLEYLKKGARIRTIKLRGFISQGLCLPIPEGKTWEEGLNVADLMGIIKYEPPEPKKCSVNGGGQVSKKKLNPLFDKYTDIDNVKNYNLVFKEGDEVVITEKIHGTNFRAGRLAVYPRSILGWIQKYIFGRINEFVYGSHNVQKKPFSLNKGFYGEDVYGIIAKRYKLAEILPEGYIIYGEIYGNRIQELSYGVPDSIEVAFFDVKKYGLYLSHSEFLQFCCDRSLPIVPILFRGKFKSGDLKTYTSGKSVLAKQNKKDQIREGCVITSYIEENHPRIGRKILKSVSEEYLLTKNRTEYH